MKKAAIVVLLAGLISKVLGFIRDIALSYFYGISHVSDAYIIALTIPEVIVAFIAAGIMAGYIPIYNSIESNDNSKSALFTNNLINVLMLFCSFIIMIGFMFTEQIVKIFASGFEGETLEMAIMFTKISLFGCFFTILCSVFSSFLQLKDNFAVPAAIGIPSNIIIIIFIIISAQTNNLFLVIGTLIASLSQFTLVLFFAIKKGYKYKFTLNIFDSNLKKLLLLVIPMMLSVSINQINILIDRTLASNIIEGGIAIINYANRLNLLVYGLFIMSIVTIIYPKISKKVVENDILGVKVYLSKAILAMSLLVVPAVIGLIALANPIITFLFGRGEFDQYAIELTASVLIFLAIGMYFLGLNEITTRVFFSFQDTKTPMINSIIGILINIILNFILSKYMGVNGLALATSLATITIATLNLIILYKKINGFYLKSILIDLLKIIFSSLVMGINARFIYNYLIEYFGNAIILTVTIIISTIIYLILIFVLRVGLIGTIVEVLNSKYKALLKRNKKN